ncbi:MAG: alpha/beta hydrolase [Nannocystaceae bacterium]
MDQLLIVPRWSGRGTCDWYPWVTQQLEEKAPKRFTEIRVFEYPNPDAPTIAETSAALTEVFDQLRPSWPGLALVGHSVGCQALLRALAHSGMAGPCAGLLCVAGWWSVDKPWPSIRPWVDRFVDFERARGSAGPTRVLLSDNDPFTRDWQGNASLWKSRMRADVSIVPGAKHFNQVEEPAVLEAILDHFS